MAAIAPTKAWHGAHTVVYTWTAVTSADTFVAVGGPELSDYSDRNVQWGGTFDSATVLVQGSNDASNYISLTDPQGNALSKTAAAIEQIVENTLFIKPSASGGGGSQSLTVILVARRGRGGMEV